jgi:hypothetical protein
MPRSSLSIASHLDRLDRTGLSVVEYARRGGVNPWSLYKLRYLRRKKGNRAERAIVPCSAHHPDLTFTQISPVSPLALGIGGIELAFPDGMRAILPRGFDTADLRNVISALSAARDPVAAC